MLLEAVRLRGSLQAESFECLLDGGSSTVTVYQSALYSNLFTRQTLKWVAATMPEHPERTCPLQTRLASPSKSKPLLAISGA